VGAVGRSPALNHCWVASRSAAVALEEARAEVSYWVLPAFRGRGVAPLALGAVADWAFDDVGFHRLELDHSTQNAASCREAIKAGFVAEGTKRAQALHLDGWHDMHAHGLLSSDARPDAATHSPSWRTPTV